MLTEWQQVVWEATEPSCEHGARRHSLLDLQCHALRQLGETSVWLNEVSCSDMSDCC